jgi:hypothetical protein
MTTLPGKLRAFSLTGLVCLWLFQSVAWGDETWRSDFDDICSKTDQAMTLTLPELTLLVERCGALQKVIETQEESVRKVYLKRLQMCRNLYAYMVEFKKNEQPSK